jgi:hypothetical protein
VNAQKTSMEQTLERQQQRWIHFPHGFFNNMEGTTNRRPEMGERTRPTGHDNILTMSGHGVSENCRRRSPVCTSHTDLDQHLRQNPALDQPGADNCNAQLPRLSARDSLDDFTLEIQSKFGLTKVGPLVNTVLNLS